MFGKYCLSIKVFMNSNQENEELWSKEVGANSNVVVVLVGGCVDLLLE